MTDIKDTACEIERVPAFVSAQARKGNSPVWLAGVLSLLLLIGAGIAYRAGASGLKAVLDEPIQLPVPLTSIPLRIRGWAGEELPIPETTRDYMQSNFADDYTSRRYINTAEGLWADVYVVYCASRLSGLLGHRPRVCYPAHGWVRDATTESKIVSHSGRPIQCLVHRFHKPAPEYRQVFVLSFYVLNGQITLSESEFSGFFGRRPNISGNPARYVAQVQISSTLEHSARAAASNVVDIILAFLPDQQGRVEAARSTSGLATDEGTGETRQDRP